MFDKTGRTYVNGKAGGADRKPKLEKRQSLKGGASSVALIVPRERQRIGLRGVDKKTRKIGRENGEDRRIQGASWKRKDRRF